MFWPRPICSDVHSDQNHDQRIIFEIDVSQGQEQEGVVDLGETSQDKIVKAVFHKP